MKLVLWTALASAVAVTGAAWCQSTSGMMGGQGMMGQRMMGGGMMMGSMARRHQAMMYAIPEPYGSMRDPLPDTVATLDRGAAVYAQNCAACHGPSGYGDGPAGKDLNPPPANLTWLSHSHMMGASDQYIYWTVADGGRRFGTAMPAFKAALPPKDIWAVVAYVRQGVGRNRQ